MHALNGPVLGVAVCVDGSSVKIQCIGASYICLVDIIALSCAVALWADLEGQCSLLKCC